jgi:TolB-like protein/Flp pilus assembly protein TadD
MEDETIKDAAGATGGPRAVFLSYASQDADVAHSICQFLESRGLLCWMAPRDVPPGALYADAIIRGINEARTVVLVLSASAVASSHVGKEIERASSKRKPVIAFRIDAAALSPALEYFLSESQWIDVPALGMPAALAKLAEAVTLGPGPVRITDPSTAGKSAHVAGARNRRVAVGAVVILVGVGLAVAVGVRFWTSSHSAPPFATIAAGEGAKSHSSETISDKSIAVLPFADMSEKHDQEYFADGMAEEITEQLAKIPGLKVIGRTSAFQFKGHSEDLRTIGVKLSVAYILEGSVRKSGDRVRVTAQLIQASDGAHRWSGSYDRDLVDTLKAQDEISIGLARALQLSMGSDEPSSRPTFKSAEGYTLYLRGRQAFDRLDKAGYEQAASYFRQAMQLDPDSPLAPAWLAFVYMQQAGYGFVRPDTGYEEARRNAERTLNLDPRMELATAVLGAVHILHDWNWAAGATELDRALALAPGNARMLLFHSEASWVLGQWDSAIRDLSGSVTLDPLYPAGYELLGEVQLGAGHWSEAETAFRKALDIAPHYAFVHFFLAEALLLKGEKQGALQQIDLEPDETLHLTGRAAIDYALGRKADSDAAVKQLTERASAYSAYVIACAHAYREEKDAAFFWLERAFAQKEFILWGIKSEPFLNPLKGDARYKAFLKKMNLPE